ncbi:MAG: thioredoxin family protein [Planctomycetota bacterium]
MLRLLCSCVVATSVAAIGAAQPRGFGAPAPAAGALEAAKQRARVAGHDVLLIFTGPEWCSWSRRLAAEVLGTAEFRDALPERFVPVMLEFARDATSTPAEHVRLRQEYAVQGLPTVVLADADGRPYARLGYRRGGADAYVQHLDRLRLRRVRRDRAWAAAAAALGQTRAGLLAQGLGEIDAAARCHYIDVMREIVALAAVGSPLHPLWRGRLEQVESDLAVDRERERFRQRAAAGEWRAAAAGVGTFLRDAGRPSRRGELHYLHGVALAEIGAWRPAVAALRSAVTADPTLIARVRAVLERIEASTASGGDALDFTLRP